MNPIRISSFIAWTFLSVPPLWSMATLIQPTSSPEIKHPADVSSLALHQHLVHLREIDIETGHAVARFEFHNAGNQPLTIKTIKPSCGCVTVRIAEMTYQPEEIGEFFLQVDTANESSGQQEYDVQIQYEDGQSRTSEVRFLVDVPEKKLTVRPSALIFYQLSKQETEQVVELVDFRQRGLEIIDVTSNIKLLSVGEVDYQTNDSGNPQWTIRTTAAAVVPSGRHTGKIVIRTSDPKYSEIIVPVIIFGPQAEEASATP